MRAAAPATDVQREMVALASSREPPACTTAPPAWTLRTRMVTSSAAWQSEMLASTTLAWPPDATARPMASPAQRMALPSR
eukprot:4444806-Prymnesium_polylepis.1